MHLIKKKKKLKKVRNIHQTRPIDTPKKWERGSISHLFRVAIWKAWKLTG